MKLPTLAVPKLGIASFRRRILFRGVFLLLALATVALALALLIGEKERSYAAYRQNFAKTLAEIVAKLRHPAGQLVLLNPSHRDAATTPLRPLLLPFGALDFDDPNKARYAVETAGCAVQYPNGGSACVAVGNNPYAGGFIYVVGSFLSGPLVSREGSSGELSEMHRARVSLKLRGETTRWIAPFEAEARATSVRGRLTGFIDPGERLPTGAKPLRDFRGWLWQDASCADTSNALGECTQRSFFLVRLPVDVFRDALFQKSRPVWPPPDLDRIEVQFEMLPPGEAPVLFDSNAPGATAALSLNELSQSLLAGETLRVQKVTSAVGDKPLPFLTIKGIADRPDISAPWLDALVRRLPVEHAGVAVTGIEKIHTAIGSFDVQLTGDLRSVDRAISVVATRLSWFVAAMQGAIALAWLVIEIGLIRRIAVLTKRAAAVSQNIGDETAGISALDLTDLRGRDELGILASGLSDLLQRVKADVQREQIRAQQEREMWHAVGHEIMSPLQSLMVLHPSVDDASNRYVQRMQQAVRVLYGTASPSEALEAATLSVSAVELDEFLHNVAANAHFAGIDGVTYQRRGEPVLVRADEFPLEDVVTHILRNAARFRLAGTPIVMRLATAETSVTVTIHNQGIAIAPARLTRIFEYGESDRGEGGHRGQGLFVAKTYMAKMGGTVSAANVEGGVAFGLVLQRAG